MQAKRRKWRTGASLRQVAIRIDPAPSAECWSRILIDWSATFEATLESQVMKIMVMKVTQRARSLSMERCDQSCKGYQEAPSLSDTLL